MNTAIKSVYLITAFFFFSLTAYADNTAPAPAPAPATTAPAAPAATTATTAPAATGAPTLAGNYQCQRIDASNNTNSYPLTITINGAAYSFEWDNTSGYPVLYGTGVMHPSKQNLVSVSFMDPKNADTFGVEFFEIKPDGSLQANWAVQSTSQLGSETCTKSK